MYRDIKIKNFRGIKQANLDGFKRVNLLFGKNNVGKSSLLEAIFISSGQSNPVLSDSVNGLRDYRQRKVSDFELLFSDFDTTRPIEISTQKDQNRSLSISFVQAKSIDYDISKTPSNISTVPDSLFTLRFDYSKDDEKYKSEMIFRESKELVDSTENPEKNRDKKLSALVNIDQNYKEDLLCKYVPARYNYNEAITSLEDAIKDKQELAIIEALRIIEPRIKDIVSLQDGVFVDVGFSRRLPINMMGDGIRKLLAIIISIYECKDGILLIDEIDNGIHHSFMSKIWDVVIRFANTNNTQIFATTHNIDSIKGLTIALGGIEENMKAETAGFKLVQNDGVLSTFPYSYESLDYVIDSEIEIR